jgi:peptidoglycan/xylan/chitin deacetylase (PgdA/CDA1 family)
MQANTIMDKYMHAPSTSTGSARRERYMTTSDALSLQADGNEIGGHTVSHADLPTLSTDEAKRQARNDRELLDRGLNVKNFAYPYGDATTVEQIVQAAVTSQRVVSATSCHRARYGCAYEQIPPVNAHALDTPDSIKNYNTLVDMENYVLQAEQHHGGWVILVMHHLCSNCDPYSVAPAQLDSFLSWLAPRAAGGTTVKTVDQVIGGALQPGVNGPPPPPPLSTTNLLRDPSWRTSTPPPESVVLAARG